MRVVAFACCLAFGATPALAQRADLPPAEKVNEVLDSHPSVAAALARVEAARARGDMLRKGPHEVTVSGSYIRRTVDREGESPAGVILRRRKWCHVRDHP